MLIRDTTYRSSKVLDIESKLAALWPTKNVDSDRIIEQLEWTLPLGAVLGKKLLVISSNAPTDKEFKVITPTPVRHLVLHIVTTRSYHNTHPVRVDEGCG